jgi:hypothetical protein
MRPQPPHDPDSRGGEQALQLGIEQDIDLLVALIDYRPDRCRPALAAFLWLARAMLEPVSRMLVEDSQLGGDAGLWMSLPHFTDERAATLMSDSE